MPTSDLPRDVAPPAPPTAAAAPQAAPPRAATTPLSNPEPAPPQHREPTRRPLLRDPRTYLVAYAVTLAAIAFWPTPVDRDAGPLLQLVTRLVPALAYARIEFLANVVLFVPLGLLLTFLLVRRRWLALPIVILATVTIECGQALLLHARTPSLLDVLANTIGGCLGILVALFIASLRRRRRVLQTPTEA